MPTKHGRTSFIIWLSFAVFIAGLITYFSSQIAPESNEMSKGFTRWLLALFDKDYAGETLRHYNNIARKAAHFTLYMLLGFSLTGVLQHQRKVPKLPTAILVGAAFAALDEFHQHFVEGRGPQVSDVLLDTAGVAAGALLMTLILWLIGRVARKRKKALGEPR